MRARRTVKIAILLILVGGVVALYFSPLRDQLSREKIVAWVDTVRDLWYGPIVLIVSYAIGCIFAIPASIFIIAAGVIWGWKLGAAYAMAGAMLGASLSYFVGRFLGEGMLEIGVVMASLYFISRKKLFPAVSLVFGILGIVSAISGLLL